MSLAAATDAAAFHAYLEPVLLPALRRVKPDAVLVMDNLNAPKAAAVRALLDGPGSPTTICRPPRPTSTRSQASSDGRRSGTTGGLKPLGLPVPR
jgi:hypothetical protein